MFGFGIWGKRNVQARVNSLADVLDHVGVHPAEEVCVGDAVSVTATAENVLLRLVEERDAYRDMVDNSAITCAMCGDEQGGGLERELLIARRNLAYARQVHSAEIIALTASRDAARFEAHARQVMAEEIEERYRLVNREADAITDALVEFGFPDPRVGVGHDEWFDLKGAVRGALASLVPQPVEPTLREQALAVIASIVQPDGSFDAGRGFDLYSKMPGGRYVVGEFLWDSEGLVSLGYAYDMHSELGGRRCVWRPVH